MNMTSGTSGIRETIADDTIDTPPSGRASKGFWLEERSGFWIVAVGLLVLLFAFIPVVNTGSIAVPDDGVYAAQAETLTSGSWSQKRPATSLDNDGLNSAIGPDIVYGSRQIPYVKHPLFARVLGLMYSVGGFGGLIAFSVIGLWLAAVSAGILARLLDRRYGVPALVLTGLLSPLVFDGYLVSAHAMAAAMFGFVALGVAQVVDGRRWMALAYALPCAALLIGLRTEGVVAMGAMVAVVGVMSLGLRPLRIDRKGAVAAGALAATTAVAYLVDVWWSTAVASSADGKAGGLLRSLPMQRDPLGAAWTSLLRPWYGSAMNAQTAFVIGVLAVLTAAVAIKVAPSRWLLPVVLLVVAASCFVVEGLRTPFIVSGLFAAFPVILAGAILLRWSDLRIPLLQRHLAVSVLTIGAVSAITYDVGGAAEWGGRFYHLLLPLFVPVVLRGLRNGYQALPGVPARAAALATTLGLLAVSVIAIRYIDATRQMTAITVAATRSAAAESFLPPSKSSEGRSSTTRPLVVFGMLEPDGTSRIFWQSSDVDVLRAVGLGDLFSVVDRARQAGHPSVLVVTNVGPTILADISRTRLEGSDWGILKLKPIDGTPFGLVTFGPKTDERG